MHERVQGLEATFCHGKATIRPWESPGVEGLEDLHCTYGAWVDLVAQTKIQNDLRPVSKITVAIGNEKVEASRSRWFQPDPMQAMSFLPSGPQLPVEEATAASRGVSESLATASEGPQLPKAYESKAETCCFFIDPVMKTYPPNLWPDTLQVEGERVPPGLPRSPLRNYNALAVGFDWQQTAYHRSTIGPGMPTGIVTKDWDLTLSSSCKSFT